MKKQFVTYEIALKLKKLGFDEECFGYYTPMKDWMMKGKYSDGKLHFHGPNWSNSDNTMYFMYVQNSFGDRNSVVKNSYFTKAIKNVATPLWQQVFDWLREKHNIVIILYANASGHLWETHKAIGGTFIDWSDYSGPNDSGCWDKYEDVREEAILKAIESIKIK